MSRRGLRTASSTGVLPPLEVSLSMEQRRPDWNSSTKGHLDSMSPCSCRTCRSIQRHSKKLERKQRNLEKLPELAFKVGDRVLIAGDRSGTIRWVGRLDANYVSPHISVGVHLDEPTGEHDGVLHGKRYFRCPHLHGTFVSKEEILLAKGRFDLNYKVITPPEKVPSKTPLLPPVGPTSRTRRASAPTRRRLRAAQRQLAVERVQATEGVRERPWRGVIAEDDLSDDETDEEGTDTSDEQGKEDEEGDSDEDAYVDGTEGGGMTEHDRETSALLARVDDTKLQGVQEAVLQRAREAEKLLADLEVRNGRRSRSPASLRSNHSPRRHHNRSSSNQRGQRLSPPASRSPRDRSGSGGRDAGGRGSGRRSRSTSGADRGHRGEMRAASGEGNEEGKAVAVTTADKGEEHATSHRQGKKETGVKKGDTASTVEDEVKLAEQQHVGADQKKGEGSGGANNTGERREEQHMAVEGSLTTQESNEGTPAAKRQQQQQVEETQQKAPHEQTSVQQQQQQKRTRDDDEETVSAEEIVQELFTAVDVNQHGYLNALEFAHAAYTETLGLALEAGQEAALMEVADADGNGRVDWSEFEPLFVALIAHVYGDAPADQEWVEVFSRPQGYSVQLHKASGGISVTTPQDIDQYHREVYAPPQTEIDLTAMYAFHAADTGNRCALGAEELTAILTAPDLGITLTQEDLDYVAEITELATYGEVGWPHFRLALRLLLAREWFEALPGDAEWVHLDSEQFGTVFFNRETGEPTFDEPQHYVTYTAPQQ